MHRLQVQLTEEQESALRDLALLRASSISALIREGVEMLLSSAHHADQRAEALKVIGAYASGLTDVSQHHDKYLADAYAHIDE